MPGIARVGDLCQCICCCHDDCVSTIGVGVTSAGTVNANGRGIMRIGDMFACSCGHPTFVVGGSGTVSAEGIKVARLGDPVSACPNGTIITASDDVINNA